MNRLERSSVNMLSSMAGFIVPMLVNLITTPLLLHKLGAGAYGLQSFVAVIVGYLFLMDMGVAWPIIKLLAEDRARQDFDAENSLLSATLQLYAVIGVIGMVAIMLLADWLARSVFQVPADLLVQAMIIFRLAGIGFLGSIGMSWGSAVTTGLQRLDLSYLVSAVSSLMGTFIGLGAVYAGYGVVGYVLVRIFFTLLTGPSYFFLIKRLLPSFCFSWGIHHSAIRRVTPYLGYGTWNRILGSLIGRLDQTLIGIWSGVASAGVYSVAFMLNNSLGYMISYMLGFIFPMTSELESLGQMDRLRDIFTRASQFIAALAGLIFIPLFILGDLFLAIWTPSIATQAAGALHLLALAGYIGTLTASLPNNVIVGLGKMRQFTTYTTIRAAILAAFCFIFIRPFGLEGAGWALLLTCSVDIVYLVVVSHYYLQIAPLQLFQRAYLKPMFLGIGFAGLTFLVRPFAVSWLGLGLVGSALGLAYIIAGFTIGVFGETEKRALRGLWQLAIQQMKNSDKPA